MAQVSYPGVYIQEIPSGVRTITGVSTSIAAFFGRASKGPINKAMRILSLSDFERQFGAPFPKNDLAASVQQFFNNGGTDCYVVRIARDPDPAKVTLETLAGNGTAALDVTAKAEGLWGNTVRMEIDYNTFNPDESFNLTVIQEDGGAVVRTESFTNLSMDKTTARYAPDFVTQSSELITMELAGGVDAIYSTGSFDGFSQARRPLEEGTISNLIGGEQSKFQISVNGSNYITVDLADLPAVPAADFAAIEANIQGKINTALEFVSPQQYVSCGFTSFAGGGEFLTITSKHPDPTVDNVSVRVKRTASDDIAAALMLGVDQGGIEPVRWGNFRPAPTASILRLGDPDVAGDIASLDAVTNLEHSDVTLMTIDGVNVDLDGDYKLQTRDANDTWNLNKIDDSPITGDNDGVREKLKIMARAINAKAELTVKAEVWGYHLAIIATEGTISYQPTIVTAAPDFGVEMIPNVRQYSLGAESGGFTSAGLPGTDGDAPGYEDYLGNESDQTGFHALDSVDLFNLMILPADEDVTNSTMQTLWGPASTYCAGKRAFLLVDPPASWTSNDGRPAVVSDTDMINELRMSIVKDYAAVFYPRLQYSDSGLLKTIGPAGAIAGLMARTDANRGVWKAPAGIEAGIRNILGVTVELTDAENGVLNKKGVNCIRVFPNGIVNWGSRTLYGDDDFGSEWKYIPVRRLALNIEESLFRGTKWVVFEPNDEPLWANIRLNVGAFMMSLFRQGAFQGTSPKEAFFVKCDKETTTQDDINKGIVNIRVGFAPLKPAEFVVITIQQMAGEL